MRFVKIIAAIATIPFASVVSGCGTLSQFTNPTISSDHLDEEPPELNKLKLVSGDRRLMRVVATGKSEVQQPIRRWWGKQITFYSYSVCAETQADAISARGAKGTIAVEKSGSLADENIEQLTVTNTRSEVSDVVRQLGWQLCNARLNGDLTDTQYRDALLDLQERAFGALGANSNAEKSAVAAAASAKAAAESATKAAEAAKSAGGKPK